jgi:hypothetical protein
MSHAPEITESSGTHVSEGDGRVIVVSLVLVPCETPFPAFGVSECASSESP